MSDKNELPELPESLDIPYFNKTSKRMLSDEVFDVFGVEFPNINHFQTAKGIIGIPRGYILDIIRKGNSMKLVASSFLHGRGIASSFNMTLQVLPMEVDDIIDCFVGIFVGKDVVIEPSAIEEFVTRLNKLPQHIESMWGVYIDDTLNSDQAQIITVATTKRKT